MTHPHAQAIGQGLKDQNGNWLKQGIGNGVIRFYWCLPEQNIGIHVGQKPLPVTMEQVRQAVALRNDPELNKWIPCEVNGDPILMPAVTRVGVNTFLYDDE